MQLFSVLVSLAIAVLPQLTSASPLLDTRQTDAAPSRFYLQTQVSNSTGDCGTNKDGLYVFSYHTGAGLGIAAALAGQPTSWFYLNDTALLFTYENNQLVFNEISISIADGPATPGFSVNGTGLQQNNTAGWLVCDWWYGAPQIFAYNGYYHAQLPNSCSQVNLMPRAVV